MQSEKRDGARAGSYVKPMMMGPSEDGLMRHASSNGKRKLPIPTIAQREGRLQSNSGPLATLL